MNNKILDVFRIGLICFFLPGLALAQHDAGIPQIDDIKGLYPGKTYSPYAQRSSPARFIGAKRTCTPGYPSMPGCSAAPSGTKKRTVSRAAKR